MKHSSIFVILLLGICFNSYAQKIRSISDGERRIYYKEIEEAEYKLLEIIQTCNTSFDFPSKLFVDLILNDERCFDYDFSKLSEASSNVTIRALRIITSDNGNLRLYTWDADGGRSITAYSGITSIKNEFGITSYASPIGEELHADIEIDKNQQIGVVACGATEIKTIPLTTGDKAYIIKTHESVAKIMQITTLKAYKIENSELSPCCLFPSNSGYSSSYSYYIDPTQSYGEEIRLNDLELVIPETMESVNPYGCNRITGRYLKYKFIEDRFEFVKIEYSDLLYSDLCNYEYNIISINASPWLIRIDKMPNGRVRYTSWKNKSEKEKPDLIIPNGYCASSELEDDKSASVLGTKISKKEKYIFQNNDYFYEVSWIYEGGFEFTRLHSWKVVVKHNEKVLMTLTPQ